MAEIEKTVLFSGEVYSRSVSILTLERVYGGLKDEAGIKLTAVDDLCRFVLKEPEAAAELVRDSSLEIIAFYPRAVKWAFSMAGIDLPDSVTIYNMHTMTAKEIVEAVLEREVDDIPAVSLPDDLRKGDWVPWFPIIDYDRCTSCRQCVNFCIFGVYSIGEDGKVVVENPENCKNNCPACARLCPTVAIMFPKLKEPPLNGDEVPEGTIADVPDSKLGEDLYDSLRERRKSVRAKRLLREAAYKEREKCRQASSD